MNGNEQSRFSIYTHTAEAEHRHVLQAVVAVIFDGDDEEADDAHDAGNE